MKKSLRILKTKNKYTLKIITVSLGVFFCFYCIFYNGLSYDQIFHIENGERRLKYLFTLGKYDYYDILHLRYYPGLYDTISALLASAFPRNFYYEGYYIINFLTGLLGIFGLKKVIKSFFGTTVSKIFFIISMFSPIYFGHLAINPKDTIIATANFWILYYVIKYLKSENVTLRKDISIKMGLFVGLGAGVRILFLGTLIPIIFFLFVEIFFIKKISKKINFQSFLFHIFLIIFIAYTLLILCWPNTHNNIIWDPFIIFFQSLNDSSQGVQLSYFIGKFYHTSNTPWNYIPLNLFYKIPVFYLIVFLLGIIHLREINRCVFKNSNFFYYSNISLFFLCMPVVIAIFLNLKIHDGLRYFVYLIPLFNIIPSIFLYYLYKEFNSLKNKIISIFLLPFLIVFIVKFVLISPYHYSYLNLFNDIFLKKNFFENDYWGTSSKELIKRFSEKVDNNKSLNIATCGINHINVKYYLKKNGIKNYNFVGLDDKFDYAILINRAIFNNKATQKQTCYSKFLDKKVFISVKKSFIDLSKIVEY